MIKSLKISLTMRSGLSFLLASSSSATCDEAPATRKTSRNSRNGHASDPVLILLLACLLTEF